VKLRFLERGDEDMGLVGELQFWVGIKLGFLGEGKLW
jgi:hypothetical protein